MSAKYANIEHIMKQIIEMIKDNGFISDNVISDVNSKLDQLNGSLLNLPDVENNKFIQMRKKLIENIVENNIKMKEVNDDELRKENTLLYEIERSSNNLNEQIEDLKSDVDNLLQSIHKESNVYCLDVVEDLIKKTELSYTMTLSVIHQLTSSMIELPESGKLHNKLTEIKEKHIYCLKKLLELHATISSLTLTKSSDYKFDDHETEEKLNVLKNTFDMNSSEWISNLREFLNQLEQFSHMASDNNSVNKPKSLNLVKISSTTMMEKINSRLNHLIKCIRKNVNLNYENELSLLLQALSQLELNSIEVEMGTQDNVNTLKTKLNELQDLIQNRDFSTFSSLNLFHNEIESNLIFNSISKTLILDTLEHLQSRCELISVKSSLVEKEILNSILSPSEFLAYKDIENIKMSENEKLNQYQELLQVFKCFIEALKLNIKKSQIEEIESFIDIEYEIRIMKNAMIVLMTTISMLETYSELIFTAESKESDQFNQTVKSEALSVVNKAIIQIIHNEKSINISNIFLEDVESLIKSLENNLEESLTNSTWDAEKCKYLLHKSFWLINIWQYNNKPVQCSTLSERFQFLIKLLNSVKKEQYKHLSSNHFHEETTREYWFQILQDWQNRVDALLGDNLSVKDNWKLFSERVHLICEFEQIDSNIDHYGVRFEIDFLESLFSQKSELDKINKRFFNLLVDKKEPIYKYLQFVSKEIKDLNETLKIDHISMGSLKLVQRSIQTAMQILEYIHSMLDKIDENYNDKSQIINEQIRKLRLALHSSKKTFMIYSNQIGRLYDEMSGIEMSLDKLDESTESMETLLESEINTLLATSYYEMLNRCARLLEQIKIDTENVKNQLLTHETDKLKSVREAANFLKIRLLKIQQKIPKLEQEMTNFQITITAIIEQQNQTFSLKNNLQIIFTKIDVYFTGIDMKSITSRESAENYLQQIDELICEMSTQEEAIKQIEMVNYGILENSSQIKILKPIFESEVSQLVNSLKSVNQLKQVKIDLTEKYKVLCEIDKKFKFCISEIDKTKLLILYETGNMSNRISQNIETIRDLISQSHLYLHHVLTIIDKDQMTALAKDFEQMDALLDLYDELVKYKKNKENKKQSYAKFINDKNESIERDLIEFNKNVTEISSDLNCSIDVLDILSQLEVSLNRLVRMKNEVLKSAIDICTNELKDSKISAVSQERFADIMKSIGWQLSIITNLLVCKFALSGEFYEFFCETCKKWSLLIKNCMEFDDDKFEFHDKLVYIETIQMILGCFMSVIEQSHKLAIFEQSIHKLDAVGIKISDLFSYVKKILESSKKLNTKMSDFQILRTTLLICSDKLNFHLLLVESLSEDCGVQKHLQMKQQSNFYRAYIKYHQNLYRLFDKITDSILDENVLGFEIEDGIQISLEEMTKSIEAINKKHQSALRDIDSSLAEWEKSWQTETSTRRFMKSLYNVLKELNDNNLLNKVHYHMYIEKLSLLIKHLKDKEFQWSNLKIKIGSSSDQAFLQKRIKITQACVSVSQSLVARNSICSKSLLSQYQELCTEAEHVKLNLLTLLNDSHYFYLENELKFSERQQFLIQFIISLNQTEKTIEIWKMRSKTIYPGLMDSYCSNINLKSQNLEQWFQHCLKILDEITLNLNQYEALYNSLQIKLNVLGEYLEQIEDCDTFLKNIFAKFYQYNSADLQNCVKLSQIIIKQMNEIEFQLQQLHNLKEQLFQLNLGQNDNCQECDKGKLTDFQQVVKVISDSQAAIKEKLLNILNQGSKETVRSTLTYSCCEDEVKCYDKQISVSGDIESFVFLYSNETHKADSLDSGKIKLPSSSIAEQIEKRINNLTELLKQVFSSVDEQEAYLNEKWKNQIFDSPNISVENADNKIESNDKDLFSSSTPLSTPLTHTDMHHWFPNSLEVSVQTNVELDFTNLISPLQRSSETSVICPDFHLSGLTSSEEIRKSNSDLLIITDERNNEAVNKMESVKEMIDSRILALSSNSSSLFIECINQNDSNPYDQAINKVENYENIDIIDDKGSWGVLETCNQQNETEKLHITSDECESFTNENKSTDKLQDDSNEIEKENVKNKQTLTIDVLHSILHDIVDKVIKDDIHEPEAIGSQTTESNLIENLNKKDNINFINSEEFLAFEHRAPISNGNLEHNTFLGVESNLNADNISRDRCQGKFENENKSEDSIYIEVTEVTEEVTEKPDSIPKSQSSENSKGDKIDTNQNICGLQLEYENKFLSISGDNGENESDFRCVEQRNANNENINSSINIVCKISSNNDLIIPNDKSINIDGEKEIEILCYNDEIHMEKDVLHPDYEFDMQLSSQDQRESLTEVSSENSVNESFVKLNSDLNEIQTPLNLEAPTEVECNEFNVGKPEDTSNDDSSIIRVSETAEDLQSNENELQSNVNSCTIKEVLMKESLIISSPFTIENTNMNVKDDYKPIESGNKISDREIFYKKHPNTNRFIKLSNDSQKKDRQNEGNANSSLNAIEIEVATGEMNIKCSRKSLMTETAKLCIPNISNDEDLEDIQSINGLSLFSALETFENLFTDILINEIDNEIDNETIKCRENEVGKSDTEIHNEVINKDSKLSENSSFTSLNVENLNELQIDYDPTSSYETGDRSEVSIHHKDTVMFHSINEDRNMRVNVNIVKENPQPLLDIDNIKIDFFNGTIKQENDTKTAGISKTESYSSQTDMTKSLDSQNSKESFVDCTADVKADNSVQIKIESRDQIDLEPLLTNVINVEYPMSSDVHKHCNIETVKEKVESTESTADLSTTYLGIADSSLLVSRELSDISVDKGYVMCKTNSNPKALNETSDELRPECFNKNELKINPLNESETDLENKTRESTVLLENLTSGSTEFKDLNTEKKETDNDESPIAQFSSHWKSESLPETVSLIKTDEEKEESKVKTLKDLTRESEIMRIESNCENSESLLSNLDKTDKILQNKNYEKFELKEMTDFHRVEKDLKNPFLKEASQILTSEPRNLNVDLPGDEDLISNQGENVILTRFSGELNSDLVQKPTDLKNDLFKKSDQDHDLIDRELSITSDSSTEAYESVSKQIIQKTEFDESLLDGKESEMKSPKFENPSLDDLDRQNEQSLITVSPTNSNNEMFRKILNTKYNSLIDLSVQNDIVSIRNTSQNHLGTFENSLEVNHGIHTMPLTDNRLIGVNIEDSKNKITSESACSQSNLSKDNTESADVFSKSLGQSVINPLDTERNIPGDMAIDSLSFKMNPNTKQSDITLNIVSAEDPLKGETIPKIDLDKNKELFKLLFEPIERIDGNTHCDWQTENVNVLQCTPVDSHQIKSVNTQMLRQEVEYDEGNVGDAIDMYRKTSKTRKLYQSQNLDRNADLNCQLGADEYTEIHTTSMPHLDDITLDFSSKYESNLYFIRNETNENEEYHNHALNFENELDLSQVFDSSINAEDSDEGVESNEKDMSDKNIETYSSDVNEMSQSSPCRKQNGDFLDNGGLQLPRDHVLIVSIDNENHVPPKDEKINGNSNYKSELRKYINVDQSPQLESDYVIYPNLNDGYGNFVESEFRKDQQEIFTRSTIERTSLTILPKFDKPALKKRLSKSLEIYSHSLDFNDHPISNSTSQEMVSFSYRSEEEIAPPSFSEQIVRYQNKGKPNQLNVDKVTNLSENIHNLSKLSKDSQQKCDCGLWKLILLAFILAILIVSFCTPHIPISRHCNSFYYDILHNMNPFHIKRFVPV